MCVCVCGVGRFLRHGPPPRSGPAAAASATGPGSLAAHEASCGRMSTALSVDPPIHWSAPSSHPAGPLGLSCHRLGPQPSTPQLGYLVRQGPPDRPSASFSRHFYLEACPARGSNPGPCRFWFRRPNTSPTRQLRASCVCVCVCVLKAHSDPKGSRSG